MDHVWKKLEKIWGALWVFKLDRGLTWNNWGGAFITYAVAHHQGVTEKFWLNFWVSSWVIHLLHSLLLKLSPL